MTAAGTEVGTEAEICPLAAPAGARGPSGVGASWLVRLAWMLAMSVALLVSATALLSATGRQMLPFDLVVLDHRLPVIFRVHMAASGLALVLIAAAIAVRTQPALHRVVGRLAVAAVVVGGLTALPSALLSTATGVARAGFFAQGCLWLLLLAAGLVVIRVRDRRRHRRAMLAMASVASGAIWLRLALVAIAAADWPFEACYAAAAWASWLLPLAGTIWATRPLRAGADNVLHRGRSAYM